MKLGLFFTLMSSVHYSSPTDSIIIWYTWQWQQWSIFSELAIFSARISLSESR